MFNQTKYTRIYNQLIDRATVRQLDEAIYTEIHHIIPRCCNGDNSKSNLAILTAREHFIVHWLLTKMTNGEIRYKMIYALNMMRCNNKNHGLNRYDTKITSRVYENIRKELAEIHSETMTGKSSPHKGKKIVGDALFRIREGTRNRRKLTPEENAARISKMIITRTGSKHSAETKLKMSISAKGKLKGPMSKEGKLKRSIATKGKSKSKESVDKRAITMIRLAAEGTHHIQKLMTCPYCKLAFKKLNYSRWHGDNCKRKGEEHGKT